MPYQLPVKYFNSFWMKKVVGYDGHDGSAQNYITSNGGSWDYESQVTTSTPVGSEESGAGSQGKYLIPTWPSLPWASELRVYNPETNITLGYPCFPWGGANWNGQTAATYPNCQGGSLINSDPTRENARDRQWFVEEARIEGGYNNTIVDLGVKAYAVEEENEAQHKISSIIYSGIFNSRTGVNNTNVFNMGEPITKSLDPSNGSIQKLYAYDTNLTVFQENKVSKALIDKDAIYSAEGVGTPVTSTKLVIGQIVPYAGEYGISTNPESWAQFGFRQYFSDRFRNSILRLSRDGITEISNYGMIDYFRDNLRLFSNNRVSNSSSFSFVEPVNDVNIITFDVKNDSKCNCGDIQIGSAIEMNGVAIPGLFVVDVSQFPGFCTLTSSSVMNPSLFGSNDWASTIKFVYYNKDRIVGGFDAHNKNYVLSLQNYESTNCLPRLRENTPFSNYPATVAFDEAINGWVSFYSYTPVFMGSLKSYFYSSNKKDLYIHYSENVKRGNFYGIYNSASIEFIFNPQPSTVKNFQTISYEGSNGWQVDYVYSDPTEFIKQNQNYLSYFDTSTKIYSYDQGSYTNSITSTQAHSGFNRKENKYVANFVNNSAPMEGEVIFGDKMSGLKGYYLTVKFSTDNSISNLDGQLIDSTDLGGIKELYCVGSKWVKSS